MVVPSLPKYSLSATVLNCRVATTMKKTRDNNKQSKKIVWVSINKDEEPPATGQSQKRIALQKTTKHIWHLLPRIPIALDTTIRIQPDQDRHHAREAAPTTTTTNNNNGRKGRNNAATCTATTAEATTNARAAIDTEVESIHGASLPICVHHRDRRSVHRKAIPATTKKVKKKDQI